MAVQEKIHEFSNPQMDVMETTAQRVLMHCGVGSGKSHVMGMIAFDFISFNPEVRGFIGANTYGQLTTATLDRIFTVWEQVYGLRKGIHYVVDIIPPETFVKIGPALKDYENTISFNNGGLIFLGSLENYKVIDGKEFGWALLDETKDTKEVAVKEVIITRLRQMGMMVDAKGKIYTTRRWNRDTMVMEDLLDQKIKSGHWKWDDKENKYYNQDGVELTGYNPLYVFTSPAKTRWLMEWFKLDDYAEDIEKCIYSKTDYFRKRSGRTLIVIASTYHNEVNLSPGYIQNVIDDQGGDEGKVKMLIYGSPFGKEGGEYYSAYSRLKHVKKFDPWKDEALHLSFDFNWRPYMTCTVWQMKFDDKTGRYLVRCIKEFCLANPKNNTPSLCRAVIEHFEDILKENGCFIYGDYNGKAGNPIGEEFNNHYEVIEHHLARFMYNNSNRVITNTLHKHRRDFMNKCLVGTLPLDIEIEDGCRELKADLTLVKEDANKGKLKTKIKEGKVSFEEHGHTSDTFDYFLCSAFNNLFLLHK